MKPGFLMLIVLCGICCCSAANNSLPGEWMDEIEIIQEFPVEIDSLDEFIQSYYELLDSENYLRQFKFLDHKDNQINNIQKPLADFFSKLMELRSGINQSLCIYQIGDSHIKPGYFSTTVKSSLHSFFQGEGSSSLADIQYHFSGINGASFLNLTPNDAIFERIHSLQPDLIIISLGTNDAQGNYDARRFKNSMLGFMQRVFESKAHPAIIFTLPSDSSKNNKHNSNVAKVCSEIKSYAKAEGFAWWDLYDVMGGSRSISKWRSFDLASKDLIHFSPKGYMLQGHLFYNALIRAYKSMTEGIK